MRRAPVAVLAAALAIAAAGPAMATTLPEASPLSMPGDYSLAPPSLLQGGVVSTSFGSGGMRSTAVRLDSGLVGGNTRAFVELGTGQGPTWHGRPIASGSSAAVGVETALPYGMTLGIVAGYERDRLAGPDSYRLGHPEP